MEDNGLSAAYITNGLGTRLVGKTVIYHDKLSSTMDAARQEVRKDAADGTVVVAGEQTVGRGRIKRVWLSPPGNIALSVILYPDTSHLPYIVMLTSLAVVHSIEAVTGLKPQIKWPNDVLISGKKVCGILAESNVRGTKAYAIVGIGINVNLGLPDYPEVSATATSLSAELKREVSPVHIIRRLLVELDNLYLGLAGGEESIYAEWHDRMVTLGKKVYVKSGESVMEGVAESVGRDGSLLLRHADGSSTRIVAGDISLREVA